MSEKRRVMRKNFETELGINNRKLPLNLFVEEVIPNIIIGSSNPIKELE